MRRIREGAAEIFATKGVFFNPEMELCRDLSSLCVGTLMGKLSAVDAMCASGIRGIRYKKENQNISALSLVDMSKEACKCATRNARKNRVACRVARRDAGEYLRERGFDFVELDPFGSPAPYLHDAALSFREKKSGYLSVTATDMAVLCGAHHAACMKYYGALPLDNEFCHENAVRILAGKIILTFSPFNLSCEPIFTLSHRHYVKMVFRIERGSEGAVDSVKKLGFVSYCPSCCYREAKRLVAIERCPCCGHLLQYAGPLYLGRLWRQETLKDMLSLNAIRGYRKRAQIEKILSAMLSESAIDSYGYYDLHTLAKKHSVRIKGMDEMLEQFALEGLAASRTHFCPTAIRTGALHKKVIELVSK